MKTKLLFFFLFSTITIFSQKEANIWYFGKNAGLDFSTDPPTALTNGQLNTLEGCATISDKQGNLVLYTDGITVYNKSHQVMANGTGLFGNPSSTQSAIIVPKPLDANTYYVFTVGDTRFPRLAYSEVDLKKNGGLGSITKKNILLKGAGQANEKLTAVKGTDANTFWVITSDNTTFYAYKVDSTGVHSNPVTSSHHNYRKAIGYLKTSPNGKMLVNANDNFMGTVGAYLYNFNAQTGVISNERTLSKNSSYGVAFSKDSKKLYISKNGINQYDISLNSITAIINSKIELAKSGNALQLAPNGKIYVANLGDTFLGVINFPEKLGTNANFVANGVSLNGRQSQSGLPPFIQSFLQSVVLPIELKSTKTQEVVTDKKVVYCVGDTDTIVPQKITGSKITYQWTFTKGGTSKNLVTTEKLPLAKLTQAGTGTYNLVVKSTSPTGSAQEHKATFMVEVYKAAVATKPSDIDHIDATGFHNFDLQTLQTATILNNLDPAIFEVLYFTSKAAATLGKNALQNPYRNPTAFSKQTLYARVQNKNASTACFAITEFALNVNPLLVIGTPTNLEVCSTNTTGIFTLTDNNAAVLGGADATVHTITYHASLLDAEKNTKPLTSPYTSASNLETIFVRLEHTATGSFKTKSFTLKVNPLPVIGMLPNLEACSTNATNTAGIFTLTDNNVAVLGVADATVHTITYHGSLLDAEKNTKPLTSPYTSASNSETIFVRLQNTTTGCFNTKSFTLKVNPLPVIGMLPNLEACSTNATNTAGIFTLTDNNAAVLGGADVKVHTITYHASLLDAEKNTKPLTSPYTSASNLETIFVRLQNTTTGCFNTKSFTLKVNPLPVIGMLPSLEACSTNTTAIFTLTDNNATVLGGADATVHTITYHASLLDAESNTNPLISPYTSASNLETIFVRLQNTTTGCFNTKSFTLKVNLIPVIGTLPNLEACSTNTTAIFTLTNNNAAVLGVADVKVHTITYHGSLLDAEKNTKPLTSPYTSASNSETIFVRLQNTTTGCFNTKSFTLKVNPLPVIGMLPNLEACSTNATNTAGIFTLTDNNAAVLGGADVKVHTITYHASLLDAEKNTKPLTSPYTSASNSETIFVRLQNTTTGCFNTKSFTLKVNPLPVIGMLPSLEACSTNTTAIFTLTDNNATVLGGADATVHTITYHASLLDAEKNTNPLTSPYTSASNLETIFVRLQNTTTGCFNTKSFTLKVNLIPVIGTLPNLEACSTNTTAIFTLTNNNAAVLGVADVKVHTITYHGSLLDAEKNTKPLTSPYTSASNSETIFVRLQNTTTGCFKTESFKLIVNPIPEAVSDPQFKYEICPNAFNPITIGIVASNFTKDKVTIQWYLNEKLLPGENDFVLTSVLSAGTYTVKITSNTSHCSNSIKIHVLELESCVIPQGISPNNSSGLNDAFDLSSYGVTRLEIYNRYGTLVYTKDNYKNQWIGQTNDGKELPVGTYFYTMIYEKGAKKRSAWIYINR